MFEFPDFEKIQKEAKKRGDEARYLSDDGVTPAEGGIYTVSPSFLNGDRSWVDDFWEVLGFSGPNALVKIHVRHGEPEVRLCRTDERAWFPADDLFKEWQISRKLKDTQ